MRNVLAALFIAVAAPAAAQPPTTFVTPGDFAGQPVHEGSATRRMLLSAVQPGAQAAFLDIRPGGRVPPHAHSQEDLVLIVVVRGPVLYADGERFDPEALRPQAAGTVLLVPRGNWHFLEAGPDGALLLALPTRREALPPAVAARLPAR